MPKFAPILLFATAACLRADQLGDAYGKLYNLDFDGAHRILDDYQAHAPRDPMGFSVRAAAYLFFEMDRLHILEGEFLTSDKRIGGNEKLKPDPAIRARFFEAVTKAQELADERLKSSAEDPQALFADCLTDGMRMDYMAAVEKKQLRSLTFARRSHEFAVRLIRKDPGFADAYLTTGLTEYLVGSLPFFVRWFVRFDQVQGSKDTAVERLTRVARTGRYLGPFAKILLSIIHVREKRPEQARLLLGELSRDYPGNHLFRSELKKLELKMSRK